MGFDNDCIVNMQLLPGEYFCPICRLLVYPNEALQTQCSHLYCKPCLSYLAGSTRACPYDGYLVTEADSKPLAEVNKLVADAIGQIPVHCLFYKSGCGWQGSLTECMAHCSACNLGNSLVVCNRCSTQIAHRLVQEHSLSCPGVPPRETPTLEQAQATGQEAVSQSGKVPTSVETQSQSSNVTQAQAAVSSTSQVVSQVSTYEQWYQQYYQHHPSYDPQQHYAQYYPYQQQQFQQQQMQSHGQYVGSGQQAQSYMYPQAMPQPQVLHLSQAQHQGLSQAQALSTQLPTTGQPQMLGQVNSQQQQTQPPSTSQPLAQTQPQVILQTQATPAPVSLSHASNLQTRPSVLQPQGQPPALTQPRPNVLPQSSSQQVPFQQPQPQNFSSHTLTGSQSYPQYQPNQQVSADFPQHVYHQDLPPHPPNQMPQFPSNQPPVRPYNPPQQNHTPMPHLQQPPLTSPGQHFSTPHQILPVQSLSNHIQPHQSQNYQLQGTGGQYPEQQVPHFAPHQSMQSQQPARFPASYYTHSQPQLQNNIGSLGGVPQQIAKPMLPSQGSSQQLKSESLGGPSNFSKGKIKSGQTVYQQSSAVPSGQHEFLIGNVQSTGQKPVCSPSQTASQRLSVKGGDQSDIIGQASRSNVAANSSSQNSQETKLPSNAETKLGVKDGGKRMDIINIDEQYVDERNGDSVSSHKKVKMDLPSTNGMPASDTSSHRHTINGFTGAGTADAGLAHHDQNLINIARLDFPSYRTDEFQEMRPGQKRVDFIQSGYPFMGPQNAAGRPPRPLCDRVLQAEQGRWSGEGQFPYSGGGQPYGPKFDVSHGVLPSHGASTTFSGGPPHMAPLRGPSYHGHRSSLGDTFSGPVLSGPIHETSDSSGRLRERIPSFHGRGSHIEHPLPDMKDYIAGAQDVGHPFLSMQKRRKLPFDDRLVPNEGLQGHADDQLRASQMGLDGGVIGRRDFQDEFMQRPRSVHAGDESYFASHSFDAPFSSYSGGPPVYKSEIGGRPGFRNDGMERLDSPDFLRHNSEFGPLRSPGRDYPRHPGRFGSGSLPNLGGRLHLDDNDDGDLYRFGDHSKHFHLHPDVDGNSFTRTRFPSSGHTWPGELEGPNVPGQVRLEEHFRDGERFDSRGFGGTFRYQDHLGPNPHIRGPADIGGLPRPFSMHPRFGEPRGSYMHPREAGFRVFPPQAFPKNDVHIQLKRKKSVSMGWCRICKVDCGAVDNLELHSQTKEHQQAAMDIVLSIKRENATRRKFSEEQVAENDSGESQKASIKNTEKRLSADGDD